MSDEHRSYRGITHDMLMAVNPLRPEDGTQSEIAHGEREDSRGRLGEAWDCSCGCKWYNPLSHLGGDWGVCCNPASHRAGLLTFEHQGCEHFEAGDDDEDERLGCPSCGRPWRGVYLDVPTDAVVEAPRDPKEGT